MKHHSDTHDERQLFSEQVIFLIVTVTKLLYIFYLPIFTKAISEALFPQSKSSLGLILFLQPSLLTKEEEKSLENPSEESTNPLISRAH